MPCYSYYGEKDDNCGCRNTPEPTKKQKKESKRLNVLYYVRCNSLLLNKLIECTITMLNPSMDPVISKSIFEDIINKSRLSFNMLELVFDENDTLKELNKIKHKYDSSLCAILSYLDMELMVDNVISSSEYENFKEDIYEFWVEHKRKDIDRVTAELNRVFSETEMHLLINNIINEAKELKIIQMVIL